MRVYCAGALPSGVRVQRVLDMIVHTAMVDLHGHAQGSIDERSDVVRWAFVARAPEEANAVIGVRLATDVVVHDIGGGGAMSLAFAGNPTVLDET